MSILDLSPEAQDLLFREARTANTFTDEPVTDEQIAAIYDLVKYGPTAMNAQPLRIVHTPGMLDSMLDRDAVQAAIDELGEADEATVLDVLNREVSRQLQTHWLDDQIPALDGLTPRQAEVAYWVAQGKANAEIGTILGASPRTIDKHMERILERLGLENRASLIVAAAELLRSAR